MRRCFLSFLIVVYRMLSTWLVKRVPISSRHVTGISTRAPGAATFPVATPVDPGDFVSTVGHTRIIILPILPVLKLKLFPSQLASILYGHPLHLLQLDILPAWIQ